MEPLPPPSPVRWSWRIAVLAGLVGFVTSLWAGTVFRPTGDDEASYATLGHNLALGRGLTFSTAAPYVPSALRAPVYPLFLAGLSVVGAEGDRALLVAQSLLLALAWALLTIQASLLFTRRAGVFAGLAAALNPYLCRWSGARLSEALYILLLVAGMLAFTRALETGRGRGFALSGVLWSVSTLCRPVTATLLLPMAATVVLYRPRVRRPVRNLVILFTAGASVLLPWTVRNWIHFRAFIPLQVHGAGANFWLTTIEPSEQPRVTWSGAHDRWSLKYPEMAAYRDAGEGTLERREAERRLAAAGLRRVAADPLGWLGARLRDLPRLWLHSGRLWHGSVSFSEALRARDPAALAAKLSTLGLFSLAPLALGAWSAVRWARRWRELLPVLIVPLSLALSYFPFWVEDRYGMPAVPFFLALAGGGLAGRQRRFATVGERGRPLEGFVSVVIPSRNEGPLALESARAARTRGGDRVREVIVADGRSTDGSPDLLRADGFPVVIDEGGGKGSGLRAGLSAATQDVVVFMDADGSHDPADIPALVQPILDGKADLVIGCRMRGGSDEFAGSWALFLRLWGNNFLTLVLNSRFGVRLTDSQNGFRAGRRDVLTQLDLREKKHTIELEMAMKALKLGYRVTQVPSHEFCRKAGSSSLSIVKQTPWFLRCLIGHLW